MSGQDTPRALAQADVEATVLRHLREHPDFLLRHPHLVHALRVPHECGPAASLIEYQVASLRRRCEELRGRLAELVDNARSNEELAQRLHRLVLSLVESPGLDELFTALYQGLEEGFGADMVRLAVFAEARHGEDRGLAELLGDSPEADRFASLFAGGQPHCGPLPQEWAGFLFAGRAGGVASAAVLPLLIGERRGVLAIGARAAGRFHRSMGTLYLRQLADVVGRLIARHVR